MSRTFLSHCTVEILCSAAKTKGQEFYIHITSTVWYKVLSKHLNSPTFSTSLLSNIIYIMVCSALGSDATHSCSQSPMFRSSNEITPGSEWNTEGGDDTFLQNVGNWLQQHTISQPKGQPAVKRMPNFIAVTLATRSLVFRGKRL